MLNSQRVSHYAARLALILAFAVTFVLCAPALADTPDETFKALGLAKTASPKELYDALTKRYYDESLGAGKGSFSKYWEPIPISKYLNPHDFYKPPQTIDVDAQRAQCVECHSQVTPGWTHSWQKSVHGNLDEIRKLPDSDSRAYKKAMIKGVENNLRSMGTLKNAEPLKEVGCIDCHMGVGKDHGQHKTELRMPDAAACGQCHVQQFAERESERRDDARERAQAPHSQRSRSFSRKDLVTGDTSPLPSAAKLSSSSRWRRVSFVGVSTKIWTSWSPREFERSDGSPLPLSRIARPVCVPSGMRTATLPSSVGTSISAPSAAWTKEIGTWQWRSTPWRSKSGWGRTETTT